MDKETMLLVIAQNGLLTAAAFLDAKIKKEQRKLEKVKDEAERVKIEKGIKKTEKLAAIFRATDTGVKDYMGAVPF